MSYHQPAVIQHEMAHQAIKELHHLRSELGRLLLQLGQRLGQPVGDLHILALELAHQLLVMVARHAKGRAIRHHTHDQLEHSGDRRSTIDQVTQEDGPATGRRLGGDCTAGFAYGIAKLLQQGDQFVEAAVHIADDVKRPVLVLQVGPKRLPLDRHRLDLTRRSHHVDIAESFAR